MWEKRVKGGKRGLSEKVWRGGVEKKKTRESRKNTKLGKEEKIEKKLCYLGFDGPKSEDHFPFKKKSAPWGARNPDRGNSGFLKHPHQPGTKKKGYNNKKKENTKKRKKNLKNTPKKPKAITTPKPLEMRKKKRKK